MTEVLCHPTLMAACITPLNAGKAKGYAGKAKGYAGKAKGYAGKAKG